MGADVDPMSPDPHYHGGQGHTYPCPPHNYHSHAPSSRMLPSVASAPSPQKRCHKRKSSAGDEEGEQTLGPPTKRQLQAQERRPRRFRQRAPLAYEEIRNRALTQRMFVIDRRRSEPEDPSSDTSHPVETISLAGTTGNIYTITIDKLPTCNCPHAAKGNECKHVVYCLTRVLRVRPGLEYQLAFVPSELREIFANAPALPSTTADASEKDGNRKSLDDCGICCEDFDTKDGNEEVVYCKAACGNNVHKTCFDAWAATKCGGVVTCPYCRAPWQIDENDIKKVAQNGPANADGYVNVASQLGICGERDYSTYHQYWVHRHLGGYDGCR